MPQLGQILVAGNLNQVLLLLLSHHVPPGGSLPRCGPPARNDQVGRDVRLALPPRGRLLLPTLGSQEGVSPG